MAPDPRRPLKLRTASCFFGATLLLVSVGTFLALGGIATAQSLCQDDSLAEWWTPAYAFFVKQTAQLKPWTCTWFQIGYWWVLGVQLTFWIAISISWATGFLERHAMPLYAHGGAASALSVFACIALMDNSHYYVGYAYTLGAIAFAGFFLITFFNGLLGLALAELLFAKKHGAAAQGDVEAQRLCQHRTSPADPPSSTPSTGPLEKNDSINLALA